jgi:hypothetical protein
LDWFGDDTLPLIRSNTGAAGKKKDGYSRRKEKSLTAYQELLLGKSLSPNGSESYLGSPHAMRNELE